jgi:propionyl-CoA synthetase
MRVGKKIAYKALLDEALAKTPEFEGAVLIVDRGLVAFDLVQGRDVLWSHARQNHYDAQVDCTW